LFNKLSSWCFGRYVCFPAGILTVLGYGACVLYFIKHSIPTCYNIIISVDCLPDLKELFGDGCSEHGQSTMMPSGSHKNFPKLTLPLVLINVQVLWAICKI